MGTETTVLCIISIFFSSVLEGFWETEEDARRHQNIGVPQKMPYAGKLKEIRFKDKRQRINLQAH